MRKYLPITIAKSFKNKYVEHLVADFETCYTSELRENVRVWAWGMLDILTGEYKQGNNINSFLDNILNDKKVYDIGFHNLKFDGSFIIPQLFKRGFEYIPNSVFMDKWAAGEDLTKKFTHTITSMGQWFNIIIVKEKQANKSTPAFINIWDTYKLFPVTLKKLGIQYNTETKKIEEDSAFYDRIRPEGHQLTLEESEYLKADCLVLAQALKAQLEKYGTIYRTQASKAFTFFKESCVDEAGNVNYGKKYEGLQQWAVPKISGLEDYEGAIVRYLPRNVRNMIDKSGQRLIDCKEYYIPDYYTWADIKAAYTGGISYVNPNYSELSVDGPITVIDVNSMYPYCLRTFPIPWGRFTKENGAPDLKNKDIAWIACARVSFKLKKETNLPCIQIKEKYGRKWLRESSDYMKYGEEDMFNEDVIFFTNVDYETYTQNYNFTVHKWIYYYKFPNVSYKDGRKFIDKFYNEKQKADNIMQAIKAAEPETYLDNKQYQQAALDRQEAKIAMNSAYGKHGTKYFLYSKDSVYISPEEPVKYIPEQQLARNPEKEPSHYYCPYAAFVTAYARQMLVKAWNAFNGKALYCDTDSIHFIGTPADIPGSVAVDWDKSGALGLWKVENEFIKARYIRPKTYIEIDKDEQPHVTCAGATPEIKKLMTWDTFKVGFNAWAICEAQGLDLKDHSKLTPKQYPDGVALEYVNFEIKPLYLH